MRLVALLALAITLLAGSQNTADIGCGIDPNGCNDSRGAMDPNGRGSAIDPNG
jgi:hypothetical protein